VLGIDTNVLVRYLVRDDPRQFAQAHRLLRRKADKNESVLVGLLVLLETEWLLRSRYELSKPEILSALSALLDVAGLVFEDEPSVERALYSWKDAAADFADCLMLFRISSNRCESSEGQGSRPVAGNPHWWRRGDSSSAAFAAAWTMPSS